MSSRKASNRDHIPERLAVNSGEPSEAPPSTKPRKGRKLSRNSYASPLFEMPGLAMIVLSVPAGQILDSNRAFQELTGQTIHTLKGLGMEQVIAPDDIEIFRAAMAGQLKGENQWPQNDFRLVDAQGNIKWVTIHANRLGAREEIIAVIHDITPKKEAELALIKSEERLRRTEEAAGLGLWDWDLKTDKIYWSEGIFYLLGLSPGSVDPALNRWREFLHPDDIAPTNDAILKILETGGNYQVPFRIIRPDGKVRWLSAIGKVEKDAQGKPSRLLGVNVDITHQKRTEEALRETRARERAFLEHLPVGIWFVNAEGEIVYGNPAAQKIWEGARFVEVEKFGEYKGWWHGTNQLIQADEWAAARAVQKGETTLEEAIDIQCFDGSRKTILNSAVPVHDASGGLLGAVVFNQDISHRMESDDTLKFSESRFRLLVDQLPFSLQIVDPAGRIVLVNRAWEELWGVTLEDLPGYNLLADPQLKEKGILPFIERAFLGETVAIPEVSYTPDRGGHPGQERWTRAIVYPVKNKDGTLREVVLIHEDITGKRRAEEALKASEERFRAIISQVTVGISQVDGSGKFIFANQRFSEITGYSEEELLQIRMQDLTAPEHLRSNVPAFFKCWNEGIPFVIEKQYIRKDGSRVWVCNSVSPVIGEEGKPESVVCVTLDITDRKQSEQALKKASERLRIATETGRVGVWEWDIRSHVVVWTESLYRLHGVNEKDFVPSVEGFAALVHPEDRERIRGLIKATLETDALYEAAFRAVRPSGEVVWLYTTGTVVREDGQPVRMIGATTDVTEIKRAEENLQSTRRQLVLALEGARMVGWSWDIQSGHTDRFGPVKEVLGLANGTAAEFLEKIDPEDREQVLQAIQKAAQGETPYNLKFRYRKPDGSKIWLHDVAELIRNEAGQPVTMAGIVTDITAQVQAQALLGESEERFHIAAKATNDAIWDWKLDSNSVWRNEGIQVLFGYNPDQIVPNIQWWFELIHPEDRERIVSSIHRLINGESNSWRDEYRFRRADGNYADIFDRGYVLRNAAGKAIRMIGAMQDLTEYRRVVRALQESESFYRQTLESIPGMVFTNMPDGMCDYVSHQWVEFTGKPSSQLLGNGWLELLHPEDRSKAFAAWRAAVEGRGEYDLEYRVRNSEGEFQWFKVRGRPIRDSAGKIVRWIGTAINIEDMKRVEGAHRESMERLQAALTGSGAGTFRWNIRTNALHCDEQLHSLFGRAAGPAVDSIAEFLTVLHPEDHEGFKQRIDQCRNGGDFEMEYRIIWPDGSIHWLYDKGKTFFDPNGQPAYMAGACVDITQRKLAEQNLANTTTLLRAVTENSPDLIYAKDTAGRFVLVNPAVCGVLGRSEDKLLGRNHFEWRGETPETRAIHKTDQQVMRSRGPQVVEEVFTNADGKTRVYLSAKTCWLDETGKVRGLVGISRDITERKQAEEALRATAERLSLALRAGELGDWSWDADSDMVTLSERAAAIFGIPVSPRISWKQLQQLLHEDDREVANQAVYRALEGNSRYEMTYRVKTADGSHLWVAVVGRGKYDEQGKPIGMLGVVQDITPRKTTELALAAAQDQLRQHAADLERTVAERTARLRDSLADLEHFSYTITHDMRAPLRAMQGFGQILREEYSHLLDQFGADYLRRIIESAERMDNLITDSLNYAKAVQSELPLQPIDAGALIRGIVESYPQFQSPRARIDVIEPILPVMANPAGLTQCFSNLLSNAVKFVPPGTLPTVKIWSEDLGDKVRYWVDDNGIGIDPEQQSRVFTMFQRMTNEYEGTGVGLALVRKVVEKMRGSVGFESEPGKGSRFWVELGSARKAT